MPGATGGVRKHIYVANAAATAPADARKNYWVAPALAVTSANQFNVDARNPFGAQRTIVPNTPAPTPIYPTATLVPANTFNIVRVSDGIRTWSPNEEFSISLGVLQVGLAFDKISLNATNQYDAFNRVMTTGLTNADPITLFLRANSAISFTGDGFPDVAATYIYNGQTRNVVYDDITNGVCKAFAAKEFALGQYNPRAVVCNGIFEVSEYAIVHELGHIFDYISGSVLTNGIASNFQLGSCITLIEGSTTSYTIMGYVSPANPWARGRRGWGSGSAISPFQQSPENIPLEATADMFLNWVYRSNNNNSEPKVSSLNTSISPSTPHSPQNGCDVVKPFDQNWLGFLNQDWSAQGAPFDNGLPGETRHAYMKERMIAIFSSNISIGW